MVTLGWPFLHVKREYWQGVESWGTLFVMNQMGGWDHICYTYELAGEDADLSTIWRKKEKFPEGVYEVKVLLDREDGWRMVFETPQSKGIFHVQEIPHSENTQRSMLPIHFSDFRIAGPKNRRQDVRTRSIGLLERIKVQYYAISAVKSGNPEITISAQLPADYLLPSAIAV